MLKSIEISGFKSFSKKAIVSVDAPITAIVGPNGSGKSNIVESIRFVLGEQSMKSLRGKGSTDLLFKGSKSSSPASKLRVAIIFDNRKRVFSLANDAGKNISLDFDNLSIARELYADGRSIYSIQNTEVRLKDVSDVLSSVHIGSSGHHIISQGEADRLLSASSKERRIMIDDALGLRVYEMRIRDAMRKLDKTKINIAEIESARRELAPHLKFLQKQVEKLNEAEEARRELSMRYFHYEKSSLALLDSRHNIIKKQIFDIENELINYPEITENTEYNKTDDTVEIKTVLDRISGEKSTLLRNRENLERQLGRTEGLIEAFQRPTVLTPNKEKKEEYVNINQKQFIEFCENLNKDIDNILNNTISNVHLASDSLKSLKLNIDNFLNKYNTKKDDTNNNEIKEEQSPINNNSEELNKALELEKGLRLEIQNNISSVKLLEEDEKIQRDILRQKEDQIRFKESENYKNKVERVRLLAEQSKYNRDLEILMNDRAFLDEEKKIFEPFLINSLENGENAAPLAKESLNNERRVLERLRLKLEEVGGGSGGDIIKEYEDTKSRDEYLRKELEDLNSSINSLLSLINELRDTVRNEFSKGIDKINIKFSEFFKLMFGGGNAFLSLLAELKKNDGIEENENYLDDEEISIMPKFERGVNIHVDLPNKKVKELTMLSGGERSLVSIALLFAMSQVNPPPFLVLDETDAALDEANSRRYGDMLEKLSSETQLLVVTHNRETMSRAGTIYGVTMGSDATSKLLSIEFTQAAKIAK